MNARACRALNPAARSRAVVRFVDQRQSLSKAAVEACLTVIVQVVGAPPPVNLVAVPGVVVLLNPDQTVLQVSVVPR